MSSRPALEIYAAEIRAVRRRERLALLSTHAAAFAGVNAWFVVEFGVVNVWWAVGLVAHVLYAGWLGERLVDVEDGHARRAAATATAAR